MNKTYKNWRTEILRFFNPKNKIEVSEKLYSPSGNYYLIISIYGTGENTWEYSRGIVRSSTTNKVIADVKRNYSHFWYSWMQHHNGNEYLLCGEDYQGQTVVNLTKGTVQNYFPEAGFDGNGFCWVNVMPSKDTSVLAVEGCYWACPYDLVFFDLTKPDELPFKELMRIESVGDVKGWDQDDNFIYDMEIEIRKSDGKPYDELTDEEQDLLDQNYKLVDYKKEVKIISLKDILETRNKD